MEDRSGALHQLAVARSAEGDFEEAVSLYERALELRRQEDGPNVELARTLHNLALLCERMGLPERAAELWAEAGGIPWTPNTDS